MHIVLGLSHSGNNFCGEFLDSVMFSLSDIKADYTWSRKRSALIYAARNLHFKTARDTGADYLMMIDSDISFPHDAIKKLIALKADIATGVYYMRDYPHRPYIYNWTGEEVNVHENYSVIPEEPFKVDSCGGGFMLISKKVLQGWDYKALGKPFNHITHDDGEGGEHIGEDTSFCLRCKDRYEIWAEPSIRLGHVGTLTIYSEQWELARSQILSLDKQSDGLNGWTTHEELKFLSERASKAMNIAEIGSWVGRSTKALLESTDGVVHAIDHFNGTDKTGDFWSGAIAKERDIYSEFQKNVGHYPNLKVYKMSSSEAASNFEDRSLDMVFIDGDHTYMGVCQDIDNYLSKVRSGGTICGHDYDLGWPGVVQAVNDKLGAVDVVGSIWYKEVE